MFFCDSLSFPTQMQELDAYYSSLSQTSQYSVHFNELSVKGEENLIYFPGFVCEHAQC